MSLFRILCFVVCIALVQACDSSSSPASTTQSNISFKVQIADLYAFDQQSKQAKSLNHRNNMWEFRGDMMLLRMAGSFADESSESSSDLTYNNVFLQFNHVIGGKQTSISCKPKQTPQGSITRLTHTDRTTSGTFRLEFERCRHTYTEQTINDFHMPLVVTGSFSRLPISDALF